MDGVECGLDMSLLEFSKARSPSGVVDVAIGVVEAAIIRFLKSDKDPVTSSEGVDNVDEISVEGVLEKRGWAPTLRPPTKSFDDSPFVGDVCALLNDPRGDPAPKYDDRGEDAPSRRVVIPVFLLRLSLCAIFFVSDSIRSSDLTDREVR